MCWMSDSDTTRQRHQIVIVHNPITPTFGLWAVVVWCSTSTSGWVLDFFYCQGGEHPTYIVKPLIQCLLTSLTLPSLSHRTHKSKHGNSGVKFQLSALTFCPDSCLISTPPKDPQSTSPSLPYCLPSAHERWAYEYLLSCGSVASPLVLLHNTAPRDHTLVQGISTN